MALIDSLLEYWALGATSGDETGAHASKVLAANGTPGYGTGKVYANAREFTGADTYFELNDADLRFGGTDFSICAWFYPHTLPGGTPPTYYHIVTTTTWNGGYWLGIASLGDPLPWYPDSGVVHWGSLSLNAWHFVICDYNESTQGISISLDNGTAITGSCSDPMRTGSEAFRIGTPYQLGMDGLVGPVMLWSRLLTAGERTQLWNSGNGLTYAAMSQTAVTGEAVISGTGTLAISGNRVHVGSGTMGGAGSLSSVGIRTRLGAASVSGVGTLSGAGIRTQSGFASMAGVGNVLSDGQRIRQAESGISGIGAIGVTGQRVKTALVSMSGTGGLTATSAFVASGIGTRVANKASAHDTNVADG